MDNQQYHCWPSHASFSASETLADVGDHCEGVELHWIEAPPKQGGIDRNEGETFRIGFSGPRRAVQCFVRGQSDREVL